MTESGQTNDNERKRNNQTANHGTFGKKANNASNGARTHGDKRWAGKQSRPYLYTAPPGAPGIL